MQRYIKRRQTNHLENIVGKICVDLLLYSNSLIRYQMSKQLLPYALYGTGYMPLIIYVWHACLNERREAVYILVNVPEFSGQLTRRHLDKPL